MTPHLVLRPQAEAELLDARDWYEEQRPGLGAAFTTEVEMVLARIVQAPLTYPRVQGDIRRALVRRFPYAIYYHAMSDEIIGLGVIHARRHPRRTLTGADGKPSTRCGGGWIYVSDSGTGRYAGIQGGGAWWGTATADGGLEEEWNGYYQK